MVVLQTVIRIIPKINIYSIVTIIIEQILLYNKHKWEVFAMKNQILANINGVISE